MNYKSDLIYPIIKIENQNIYYAYDLLDIYSGRNSIINNIFLYLYQSTLCDNEINNTLKNIIDVELLHAKIISKLIYKLGIKPKYLYKSLNGFKYYNTSYLNYETDNKKIISNNILLKEQLIEKYNILINKIEDKNVNDILKRIIIDEKIHIKIFKDILTSF